jgi:hypothetical protein
MNYNSIKILSEAKDVAIAMKKSDSLFVRNFGEKLEKADINEILELKKFFDERFPGLWDEYWIR